MLVSTMIQDILTVTGWKQDVLAEKLGTTQATISRWINGSDPRGEKHDAIRALYIVTCLHEGPHIGAGSFQISGQDVVTAYREGDHIIYDDLATGADIARYINKECVVRLTDGRTFIKTLARGSEDDCWTLWSYNAPPMIDMLLEWAAKVRWVEKA